MQRAAPPAGVKEEPSLPSQEIAEYELNRGVCEGCKRKSDMGILYNKVENLVGYKRDSEIIQRRLLMPLVYDAEKGRNLFQNSCLPFYQNTPGIYQFTPAFDEKTPAFRDTQNQVVFKKMNSYFTCSFFIYS